MHSVRTVNKATVCNDEQKQEREVQEVVERKRENEAVETDEEHKRHGSMRYCLRIHGVAHGINMDKVNTKQLGVPVL